MNTAAKPRTTPRGEGGGLHGNLYIEHCQSTELLGSNAGLPLQLESRRNVLQITTSTPVRVGVRARRWYAFITRRHDLDYVTSGELAFRLRNTDVDRFPWQSVPHKTDSAVG